jgi:cellulose biosynthesis protein BcsQ
MAVAYLMASLILIPTSPGRLEIAATRRMVRHVQRVRHERPLEPPGVMIVPNRLPADGNELADFQERLAALGQPLAPALRTHPTYDAAFGQGLWVGAQAPGSPAHQEIQALAEVVESCLRARDAPIWPPACLREPAPAPAFPPGWFASKTPAPASRWSAMRQQLRHFLGAA